jgi:hypothetical protein
LSKARADNQEKSRQRFGCALESASLPFGRLHNGDPFLSSGRQQAGLLGFAEVMRQSGAFAPPGFRPRLAARKSCICVELSPAGIEPATHGLKGPQSDARPNGGKAFEIQYLRCQTG